MKQSERFKKKVWRNPPKNKSKGFRVTEKTGLGRCAECKERNTSSKRLKARRAFSAPKSHQRASRPYGGYLCNKCLKKAAIKQAREIES